MHKNLKSGAGGYRIGSGRPKGSGKYGEGTCPIRVPISMRSEVETLVERLLGHSTNTKLMPNNIYAFPTLPLYSSRVAAGAPALADEHIDKQIDLNQYLVRRPASTFLVRAEGESMINAGIYENDILVVDSGLEPTDGKIVIAALNGELTVKRLSIQAGQLQLLPENPRYRPIEITETVEFRILGVVLHVLHAL